MSILPFLSLISVDKIFIEKISGKNMVRPELNKMLKYVHEGDILYIESMSRLARNAKDFLSLVQQLQDKKVELVSLKENIDTTTPQGRFILIVFAALAELERENTLKHQREGINERKTLFYLLALNNDTRGGICDLYDFEDNTILSDGLNQGWQTSGSLAITRLAFNLYNDSCGKDSITPLNIFTSYIRDIDYMFCAIKIRLGLAK